ncbi:tyrosine-type recombinase/integrase [Planobispora rosea]|uniref:tyrosine-type recombinase/integrase n=1 Tax=Planobispora rosea TaxID=35762 RepID=UPI00083AE6FD|nr:tyrosine-type recombinase/integrase [Planobispora rosea]
MAHIAKRCNCRDERGKTLGKKCPLLTKRDHGGWWIRYEAPPDANGTRRRPWAGPYATKTLAQDALPHLLTEAESGRPVPDRKLKTGAYLRQWLGGKKSLKPSTRTSYAKHLELYLIPGIGHVPLGELREHHLDKLYEAMEQINRPIEGEPSETLRRLLNARARAKWSDDKNALHSPRPLGPTRIRRVHATLSSALSAAYRQKKIKHDPSKNVELPAARRRRPLLWTPERVARWQETGSRPGPVMVWTPSQVGAFLDFLEACEERLYPLYHLIATRGLRRAEACGIRWENIDLTSSTKTLSILEGEDDDEPGLKTDASWRVTTLDATNVKLLKAWRKEQTEEKLAAGEEWVDSGRIFTKPTGEQLDLDVISQRFDRALTRHATIRRRHAEEGWSIQRLARVHRVPEGAVTFALQAPLPPVRLHDLRHCAATLMLAGGVDMKVVSATLGHSQYWFTADTYTSVVPELAEAAAEAAVALIPRAAKSS